MTLDRKNFLPEVPDHCGDWHLHGCWHQVPALHLESLTFSWYYTTKIYCNGHRGCWRRTNVSKQKLYIYLNCVNFIGLKNFSSEWPNPFKLLRISLKFSIIFSNSTGRGRCAPAQSQKKIQDVGEGSTELSFAWRWVSKDRCALPRTTHGPSRVYYREEKGCRLVACVCAATSLDGGRWRCSCSPSSSSPASTTWHRPYPLTPEETEIPQSVLEFLNNLCGPGTK